MSEAQKTIWMKAAFDKRHSDDKKNYGVHGVDIYFDYKVDDVAIRFTILSNWYIKGSVPDMYMKQTPYAAGISWHKKSDENNGQVCDIFGYCTSDGTFNEPFDFYDVLTKKGSDGIFEELENIYNEMFAKATTQNES